MSKKAADGFSQLCIEGMESAACGTVEFVPIIYGQTVDEICREWRFNYDAELQNIILKVYYEIKDHNHILCSISGGYDNE